MRGPLNDVLSGGILAKNGAAEGIPMLIDQNSGQFRNGSGATTWSVVSCTLRQVRVQLTELDSIYEIYAFKGSERRNFQVDRCILS